MKTLPFLLLMGVCLVVRPLSVLGVDKDIVRHVVVFKYKQGTTEEQIRQVTDAFVELKKKIPGIVSIEYGVNNSPEGKNHGFTHVYLLTFVNAKARDAYLPHPDHKEFGTLLKKLGVLEDVFVIDYAPKH